MSGIFNFGALSNPSSFSLPSTMAELFEQLDRRAAFESLRPVQIEALSGLDAQANERDVVLKLGTGAGKTVVGLVFAEFQRRKHRGAPIAYLCPTNQLVSQVLDTAKALGIEAENFSDSGGVPYRALAGDAVLVTTYDRAFKANTKFQNHKVQPAAYVLDDVHSGVERVRQAYTAGFGAAPHARMLRLLSPICSGFEKGTWRDLDAGSPGARYEVPFWVAASMQDALLSLVHEARADKDLVFSLPNIERLLDHCRLAVSGLVSELSLPVTPIEENTAFEHASARLFMSASVKDGSGLIRDLGCSIDALKRVVEPPSDKGTGERMVIPVAQVDHSIRSEDIAKLCSLLTSRSNVVVLCSAGSQASVWTDAGAKLVQGSDVEAAVARLREIPRGQFVVFTQRFDGIDLPDDACRILVVDGVPVGERVIDGVESERQRNSPGYYVRAVNRFEQALGRAVRSSADYCAVLLVGAELSSFVGRKEVRQLLEPHVAEQIELGKGLAAQLAGQKLSLDGIHRALDLSLNREEGWKEAHRQRLARVPKQPRVPGTVSLLEEVAQMERAAWLSAKANNHQRALREISAAAEMDGLHKSQRAELLYRGASYAQFFDPARALEIHRAAYLLNSELPRPVELPDRVYAKVGTQEVLVKAGLAQFSSSKAALAHLQSIRGKLSFSQRSDTVEEGLRDLGELLGAGATRPEREGGRGPDVLWQFDSMGFCIEAKSEKVAPIDKSDAEQLLMSTEWTRKALQYGQQGVVSVFATNVLAVDRAEDVAFGPLLLSEATIQEIVSDLQKAILNVPFEGALFLDEGKIAEALRSNRLTPAALRARLPKFK